MKLVLLPGMDGTGGLFSSLLPYLPGVNVKIIPLPETGKQDYMSLSLYVKSQLPSDNVVLLAESFSGPIAALLAQDKSLNIKGVIFVASFLSAPNKLLLDLIAFMPIKVIAKFPFAKSAYRLLFLGENISDGYLSLFQKILLSLPSKIIKSRISAMRLLHFDGPCVELPVVYMLPLSDRLVYSKKSLEFKQYFTRVEIKKIEGPHFILQAEPQACASIILNFFHSIKLTSHG